MAAHFVFFSKSIDKHNVDIDFMMKYKYCGYILGNMNTTPIQIIYYLDNNTIIIICVFCFELVSHICEYICSIPKGLLGEYNTSGFALKWKWLPPETTIVDFSKAPKSLSSTL